MSPPASPRVFTEREVARHRTKDSCWVLLGRRVYDVTAFLRMHPGGEALILRRSGRDVRAEMEGPPHRHSENARRWMEQYYIGELDGSTDEAQALRDRRKASAEQTGGKMAEEATDTKEEEEEEEDDTPYNRCSSVDLDKDLVDWRKPLAWQVGHLGEKYDAWVHQPVDRPIRLFGNPLMEAGTKTSWYWVPVVWLPIVLYFSWYCYTTLAKGTTRIVLASDVSIPIHKYMFPVLFLTGWFLWSLVEYCIHRFVFHMKPPAHNYYLITLHFLLHGQHHKSPFDGSRLVFPPGLASLVVGSFYAILRHTLPEILATSVFVGGLCGYVVYDMIHYYLHYGSPRRGSYMYGLKAYHVKHHFEHQRAGFGITSTFWDHPFNTVIPDEKF
ncbi:fatty acid 2-hydroxylase [Scophthalmus maximus]|uniref:fatty acid 2-hydroxylase n=1 Tax=Scophthalmus maximus TaxID=52904 RepID=UPI001FA886D7|nr:fatty acid 2-hydroxylase [Scophthalmus maximus]XP_047189019.1 fatty acid 2-hydroxylase [Scophthalmus maximus]XP_047189020.1 fatty acid 2-hydroxylase [Scophthalmus maximus]